MNEFFLKPLAEKDLKKVTLDKAMESLMGLVTTSGKDVGMHNIECYNSKCPQHMHDEDPIAYCNGKCPDEKAESPFIILHKCYYCGNDLNYAYTDDEIMDHQYDSASFDPIYRVGCPLCGMLGPRAWSEKEAKELWNNIKIQ